MLLDLGQAEAARTVLREAEAIRPDDRAIRDDIADVLIGRGEWLAGAAELRESVRLDPDDPFAHDHLGMALTLIGRIDEAIAALREAARLSPDFSPIRNNLGRALLARGDLAGALEAFRIGLDLGSLEPRRRSPSGDMVREVERLIALDARRPALLRGEDKPADADEAAAFARLCLIRGHHATSARLWLEAFAAQPALARGPAGQEPIPGRPGRGAGRLRARVATSRRLDEPGPSPLARQALDWLKADLDVPVPAPRERPAARPGGDPGPARALADRSRVRRDPRRGRPRQPPRTRSPGLPGSSGRRSRRWRSRSGRAGRSAGLATSRDGCSNSPAGGAMASPNRGRRGGPRPPLRGHGPTRRPGTRRPDATPTAGPVAPPSTIAARGRPRRPIRPRKPSP